MVEIIIYLNLQNDGLDPWLSVPPTECAIRVQRGTATNVAKQSRLSFVRYERNEYEKDIDVDLFILSE